MGTVKSLSFSKGQITEFVFASDEPTFPVQAEQADLDNESIDEIMNEIMGMGDDPAGLDLSDFSDDGSLTDENEDPFSFLDVGGNSDDEDEQMEELLSDLIGGADQPDEEDEEDDNEIVQAGTPESLDRVAEIVNEAEAEIQQETDADSVNLDVQTANMILDGGVQIGAVDERSADQAESEVQSYADAKIEEIPAKHGRKASK